MKNNYVTKYPYVDGDGIIHITFQDTYDFGKSVVEIKNRDVTSFKTGKNEKDDAVLVARGNAVYASGCGMATVVLEGGAEECVIVHASPINLLFLTGQSNGAGDPPDKGTYAENEYQDYFVRSPKTMAYYTWTPQSLSISNARDYVTTTLEWDKMGGQICCAPGVLTETDYSGGFKNFSVCAGMAYEWIKQTGERVWIVNASHGGQPIHCFSASEDGTVVDNDYYQAISVFNLALETLYREVDAGHFTLNHMAYYWFQGESDGTTTEEYYYNAFSKMHEAFQNDVVYSHNGVEKKLEYCGIFTIRSNWNDVKELYLTGPRLAQYAAANQLGGVCKNVFLATKATENWIISDKNVEDYFLRTYGSNDKFKEMFGYDIPNTLNLVHPQIHYRIFGQNEMGVDAIRNTLQILNCLYPDRSYRLSYEQSDEVAVSLVGLDGYYDVGDLLYFEMGGKSAYVHLVPYVAPVWRTAQGLSLKVLTEGFEVDGFKITCRDLDAKEIEVEIYLGDKLLETRRFRISYRSSFGNNKPLVINRGTSAYPDRHLEGYMPCWDVGFLTFESGEFTACDRVDKNGWISCEDNLWEGHGGFWAILGMRLFITDTYAAQGTLGIRYTADKAAAVRFTATSFSPNQGACYVAIFKNGEKIWPENTSAPSDRSGWHLFEVEADEKMLSTLWRDLSMDVEAGDQIVFALSRKDSSCQATLYPAIEYID